MSCAVARVFFGRTARRNTALDAVRAIFHGAIEVVVEESQSNRIAGLNALVQTHGVFTGELAIADFRTCVELIGSARSLVFF